MARSSETFPSIPDVVPEGSHGVAKITHFEVTPFQSSMSGLRRMGYVPEGKYARLEVNGCLMMSDTRLERLSNLTIVEKAQGEVFIAGLGLGMIIHPILAKPEVTKVTVIEKYLDVVTLVEPTLPKKDVETGRVNIIVADVLEWKPLKGQKWDVLYFDIWPDICTENLEDMAVLHRRFCHHKRPGGWMGSWMRDTLLSQRRREKQDERRYRW
jgi:spermidine synthase